MKRVLLGWSSGKDSAWALHVLHADREVEVVGLLTTLNGSVQRVAMHGVRLELVERQAAAARLPLTTVDLPWPCSNEQYEQLMAGVVARAKGDGVTHMAFGDLFLEDVRAYRERQLHGTGIEPLFPIWCSASETASLADEMIDAGLRAVITCVDTEQIDRSFLGREFDRSLLQELPPSADRCGERGEFHSFCYACPAFDRAIDVELGEIVDRDRFQFIDCAPKLP
ncbi:MAG TPA: hypothetical protein VJ867_01530 [Gemmatimonadaceae bacterium]|nr:hypothetical protein [Gemmatimonadaceae bacterium]